MPLYTLLDSPLGRLTLVGEPSADARGGTVLTALSVPEQKGGIVPSGDWTREPAAFAEAARQLGEYFEGERRDFDLTLATRGTAFRERVWTALDAIPYGETASYGEIARRIGATRPAVRAVGTAIGANPLLILRPCHRVIGADGSLTGYAGGLDRKRTLLSLEGVDAAR
ncbi:methylated-DNA--[protein]-cysteine S-methyltransferase [Streptomyces sp. NPDC050315]|uniref:methylated-DNA--[protein]-cysteine S-methyltransferase n=1 Tax=Streptomyces sp. NPDC050315 TaxID=3155039 RepID=UPI00341BB975